jgi:hypothetical protein
MNGPRPGMARAPMPASRPSVPPITPPAPTPVMAPSGGLGVFLVREVARACLVREEHGDVLGGEAFAAQAVDDRFRLSFGLDCLLLCHLSLAFPSGSFTPSARWAMLAMWAFSWLDCTGPRSVTTPSRVMILTFLAPMVSEASSITVLRIWRHTPVGVVLLLVSRCERRRVAVAFVASAVVGVFVGRGCVSRSERSQPAATRSVEIRRLVRFIAQGFSRRWVCAAMAGVTAGIVIRTSVAVEQASCHASLEPARAGNGRGRVPRRRRPRQDGSSRDAWRAHSRAALS